MVDEYIVRDRRYCGRTGKQPQAYGKQTGRHIQRRRKQTAKRSIAAAVVVGIWLLLNSFSHGPGSQEQTDMSAGGELASSEVYPEILSELLEKNGETSDFVQSYPDRAKYQGQTIDLSEDFVSGEVPLLMQWDRRWGYDAYGKEMIGLAGCGPLCMEMAYLYFTEDTDMTPRSMADFTYENGFYTENGTSWSFWTDGAAMLGLVGEELSLDEHVMRSTLDAGGLIVCSMRPGDFTTTGHFILIRGYDEQGFYVNDPNRRSTSGKVWDYSTLRHQIRNLWSLAPNT